MREEYVRTIVLARQLAREAAAIEQRVSDCVNEAYRPTPEEVELMWKAVPPRMPIPAPKRSEPT